MLPIVPQISQVAPAIPAIHCKIAAVTAKIASVAPQLSLVAIPDVISNLPSVTSQLAAVAANLSRILSKLATIHPCSIVVSAPAYDRVTAGGDLRGGTSSRDHQGSGKGGGSCAQFHHCKFSGVVLSGRACLRGLNPVDVAAKPALMNYRIAASRLSGSPVRR